MTTRTENIDIVIREDGSRVVKRNLENLGKTATTAADRGITFLKRAITGLVAGVAINKVRELADAFQTIQNRLRLVTTDQANLNAVFNQLNDISTRTRSSLGANAELYSRIAVSSKELGVSQQELLTFTERLNKAIKISGATTQEAEAGLIQLSQGMASGTLRGDELRSVLEQLPAVADVIAKSMGVTRGQLRLLGQDGKISAGEILKAFREVGPELDEKFNKTIPTIAEGFTLLKNQLIVTTGAIFEAADGAGILGNAFITVIDWLKKLTPELVSFTRAITGSLDPTDELSEKTKVFATIAVVLFGTLKALADLVIGTVVTAFKTAGKVVGGLSAAIVAAIHGNFSEAGSILKESFVDVKDTIVDGAKSTSSAMVEDATNTIDKLVQIWDKGARQVQDRRKLAVGTVGTTAGPAAPLPIDQKAAEKAARELERLQNQLRSVLNEIAPLEGAQLEMAKAQDILSKAVDKHLISQGEEARFLELLQKHYVDILDPLGKYTRELDEQAKLLGMSARTREVEAQVIEASKALLEQGVILTKDETSALREKFRALQDLNEVTQAQDQLLSNSVEARRSFVTQLVAIQNLLADPTNGFGAGDAGGAVSGLVNAMGLDPTTLQANNEAILGQMTSLYDQIGQLRDSDLISEREAAGLRAQAWAQSQAAQLQTAQTFFTQLAELQSSKNKTIARIGKAAAITNTIIKTYESATSAYAAMAGIPYIGPALGAAAAGAAIAAGLANVQAIRAQQVGFATGGSWKVGGSGGTDSQQVAFRATPGETIHVNTPAQARAASQPPNITIQNYGTSKSFETQITAEEVRIIARDEVKTGAPRAIESEIANPNSRVSRSLSRHTKTERVR